MKPLIWKELREQAKWTPVALMVIGFSLLRHQPLDAGGAVTLGESTLSPAVAIFILLASALGYLQSRSDCRPEPRAHLLHRPISRSQIFRAKWIAAAVLYFGVTLIPLSATAIWLETTDPQKLPTTWIQALPAIAMAASCFAFYFATMWTMYRPARWFGTRLFPFLVAAALPLWIYPELFQPLAAGAIWILVKLSIGLWLGAAGAKHAFCRLADLPPASSALRSSRSSAIVFLAGSVVLCSKLFFDVYVYTTFSGMQSEVKSAAVRLTVEAQPWLSSDHVPPTYLRQPQDRNFRDYAPNYGMLDDQELTWASSLRFARRSNSLSPSIMFPLRSNSINSHFDLESEFLPPEWNSPQGALMFARPSLWRLWQIEWDDPQLHPRFELVHDRSGRLLCYDRENQELAYVITPDGFVPPAEAASASGFANPISHLLTIAPPDTWMYRGSQLLIADQQAVYVIDFLNLTVQHLLSAHVDAYASTFDQQSQFQYLWLQQENVFTVYTVTWAAATDAHKTQPVAFAHKTQPVALRPTVTLTVPQNTVNVKHSRMQFFDLDDGFAIMSHQATRPVVLVTYNQQGQWQSTETFSDVPPASDGAPFFSIRNLPRTSLFSYTQSVAWQVLAGRPSWVVASWKDNPAHFRRYFGASLVSWLAAAVVTFWLTGRRGRPRRSRILWTLTAVLLSWPAVLTVIALFPRPVRTPCSHCGKRRRVDQSLCDHCQAAWDSGQDQRISIIEHAAPPAQRKASTAQATS